MKRIEWGWKPYSDGSGYEYTLFLEEVEGKTTLGITETNSTVRIDAADWQDVSETLDAILRFANGSELKPNTT